MKLRHRLLRLGMRSVGQLSDGIRLGYRVGFDSGTMVDYVYADHARGITPLGRFIDRLMLDDEVWRAVRARRRLLVEQLRDALARYEKPALFDTAAGPGSYLFELPPGDHWAGDFSAREVEVGQARAREADRPDIHFVNADAFDPATWPRRHFDILVSSGFFDILTDDTDVRRLLAAGSAATGTGARWVLTVMETHPKLDLLRDVLVDFHGRPWLAVTRRAEEVLEMAAPLAWEAERVGREPAGVFGVVTMVRR